MTAVVQLMLRACLPKSGRQRWPRWASPPWPMPCAACSKKGKSGWRITTTKVAKRSRSSRSNSPQYYPQYAPNITPNIYPPYPPGIAVRNSPPLALSGIAPAIPPTPAPPIMKLVVGTGRRWDRWNQRFDGTQMGSPGGGAMGRCGCWTNYACYGEAAEYGEFSHRAAHYEAAGRGSVRVESESFAAHRFVHSKAFASKD
jgi:hypothetical protein